MNRFLVNDLAQNVFGLINLLLQLVHPVNLQKAEVADVLHTVHRLSEFGLVLPLHHVDVRVLLHTRIYFLDHLKLTLCLGYL